LPVFPRYTRRTRSVRAEGAPQAQAREPGSKNASEASPPPKFIRIVRARGAISIKVGPTRCQRRRRRRRRSLFRIVHARGAIPNEVGPTLENELFQVESLRRGGKRCKRHTHTHTHTRARTRLIEVQEEGADFIWNLQTRKVIPKGGQHRASRLKHRHRVLLPPSAKWRPPWALFGHF
jgi:hypothetical protein